jgi:uncharacterized membrane protein
MAAAPLTDDRPAVHDEQVLPIVIYVLYLLGAGVLTPLIGVIMAYVLKDGAGERACSHYIYQIRSFWIALAGMVVAGLIFAIALPLTLVLIGFALLNVAGVFALLVGAWFIIRAVVGLVYIARGEAHPRPRTWLF